MRPKCAAFIAGREGLGKTQRATPVQTCQHFEVFNFDIGEQGRPHRAGAMNNTRYRMLRGNVARDISARNSISQIKRVTVQIRVLFRASLKRQADDDMPFGEQVLHHGQANARTAAGDDGDRLAHRPLTMASTRKGLPLPC